MSKKLVLLLAIVMLATFAFADVNVTYRINVSTISGVGVTDSTHQVQVCGAEVGPEGQDIWSNLFLTWDDASPLATNVGGDYWELTIAYPDSMIGWRMAYKARYMGEDDDAFNWEDYPDGNRMYVMPATDTTLAVAYVNSSWTPPYTESDSMDVFFRVNMGGVEGFDSETDNVYIVGAFPNMDGSDNMWDPSKYPLTREGSTDFFTYDLKLDPANAPYAATMYRFTLGSWDLSESIYGTGVFPDNENRGTAVNQDTTIAWVWYNNTPPAEVSGDTIDVTFEVDLSTAIDNNGFILGDGDSLCVRVGYFSTAQYVEVGMTKVGFGGYTYQANVEDLVTAG